MTSCFIQIDKPFYFAGDTVNGHVYLNLMESINANEVQIKFKGWESVRWIEERVVPETERDRIEPNNIWHNVIISITEEIPCENGQFRFLRT